MRTGVLAITAGRYASADSFSQRTVVTVVSRKADERFRKSVPLTLTVVAGGDGSDIRRNAAGVFHRRSHLSPAVPFRPNPPGHGSTRHWKVVVAARADCLWSGGHIRFTVSRLVFEGAQSSLSWPAKTNFVACCAKDRFRDCRLNYQRAFRHDRS